MVSIEKISRKFIQLDENLEILDEISKVHENAFLKEKIQKSARAFVWRDR